jgi:hypothetical protein
MNNLTPSPLKVTLAPDGTGMSPDAASAVMETTADAPAADAAAEPQAAPNE